MSLIGAKAVWKRSDCSVTWLMISYLLVVEQHRTQIVIHALLKCQQENLYHEQNRSEERFSRNAETDLVCRLLLEKKKKIFVSQHFKRSTSSRRISGTEYHGCAGLYFTED